MNVVLRVITQEYLMKETAKIRKLITKRGTIEMLIPLCCSTDPVRHREDSESC